MFKNITKVLSGDPIRRELERHTDIVQQINALEPGMRQLSEAELKARTGEFKSRLQNGESLDDLLVEAFAVVREAAVRTIGLRHFDVQLVGGIILHQGKIAEMKTGEGKTLVATLPIYLNALEEKGVHLVTVNDYLARRDARWMGPVFDYLGMSVGVLQEAARTEHGRKAFLYDPSRESSQEDIHQMVMVDRREAYAADVTYGTNNEFGFDYLRDNMARTLDARSQRGHNYAILDEVDNILIDEARTPLIISGPSHDDPELYLQMAQVVRKLQPEDYEASEKSRTVALTEIGEDHVEELLNMPLRDPDRPEDITPEQARIIGHLEQALRAEHLFKRNKDYVVQSGRVVIVDEFTGRLMQGRRWSDGLHQAVEAKENVQVRQENVTYATVTLQNYFRMYDKLAGMTGTAVTEAEEFNKIYKVDVIPLPTNLEFMAMQPDSDLIAAEYGENGHKFAYFARKDDPEQQPVFWVRKDYQDVVFRTEEAKLRAVAKEILRRHVMGQPLLVGTTSVELSEKLSRRLRADSLQKLMNIEIIRDAYLEKNNLADDGMRIDELESLNEELDSVKPTELRSFSRDLDILLNPTRPENLDRIGGILDLGEGYGEGITLALNSGINHNVLNAKKHDEESAIIAWAGSLGAVTIATNMAGRGVDIKLGGEIAEEIIAAVNRVLRRAGYADPENMSIEERVAALDGIDSEAIGIYGMEVERLRDFMDNAGRVRAVGGLHVIGSERHESRRIDNQLRGRAARQGDPGSSQFFLSLEDELMRLFGGIQVSNLMQRLNIDDAVPIGHNIVNRTIEQAQTRVEGANFDTRKHLLEYDDVLNQQREVFYGQRNRVFVKDNLREDVDQMLAAEVHNHVFAASNDPEGPWRLLAWLEEIQPSLDIETESPYPSFMIDTLARELEGLPNGEEFKKACLRIAESSLQAHGTHLLNAVEEQFARVLERIDEQVGQRVDVAEIAVEAAIMEAEETGSQVDPGHLLALVEQSAGLRIQMDDESLRRVREEPEAFLKQIPDLVEASMGMRMWAGLVHTVERRVGAPLKIENQLAIPIDWDLAERILLEAVARIWQDRTVQILKDVESDLNTSIKDDADVTRPVAIRTLIQMSYGQQSFFDRKTHQRRAVLVARMSYPYHAATLIGFRDPEALADRVLGHLQGAMAAIQGALGNAEFNQISRSKIDELDERTRETLVTALEEDGRNFDTGSPLSAAPPDLQDALILALGNRSLTRAYRELILSVGDRQWVEYLTQMEALRTSIGLEAYGQRDPLVQYKSRAFDLFEQLLADIRADVISRMFRIRAVGRPQSGAPAQRPPRAQIQTDRESPQDEGSTGSKRKRRRKRR
jgi:preprotein translocase subunit SecA